VWIINDREEDMDPVALKENFALVAESGEDVAAYFYDDLFKRDPGLRALFPGDLKVQYQKLLTALANIVEFMDDPAELVPLAQELGRRHAGYGVLADYFPTVGASLIETLKHFSGDAWNDDLEKGWAEAYGVLAQVMTEALGEAA
jgi:hemoglobin-like flavoprotein